MTTAAPPTTICELRTDSADEFWNTLSPQKTLFSSRGPVLYCGQARDLWQLTPTILRPDNHPDRILGKYRNDPFGQVLAELWQLNTFAEQCDSIGLAIPNDSRDFRRNHLDLQNRELLSKATETELWPHEELFELMALAHHHGLPTRLLDWTRRAYVAAYFAASSTLAQGPEVGQEERLVVWVLDTGTCGHFREIEIVKIPGSNNSNIAAQAGAFTLLRHPSVPATGETSSLLLDEYLANAAPCPLMKVTVPVAEAGQILNLCQKYGITGATLFPSYCGAAKATLDDIRRRSTSISLRSSLT